MSTAIDMNSRIIWWMDPRQWGRKSHSFLGLESWTLGKGKHYLSMCTHSSHVLDGGDLVTSCPKLLLLWPLHRRLQSQTVSLDKAFLKLLCQSIYHSKQRSDWDRRKPGTCFVHSSPGERTLPSLGPLLLRTLPLELNSQAFHSQTCQSCCLTCSRAIQSAVLLHQPWVWALQAGSTAPDLVFTDIMLFQPKIRNLL